MSDFLNPHVTRPAIRWTSGDPLPAVDQTGLAAPLLVDATTGALLVSGGGGGGGSTDMGPTNAKLDTLIGIETVEAADTAAINSQLTTGSVAVKTGVSSLYTYNNVGAISGGTVLVGPIDASIYRQFNFNCSSFAGGQILVQISNDSTNWVNAPWVGINSAQVSTGIGGPIMVYGPTYGTRFVRVIQNSAASSGTMTFSFLLTQEPYTSPYFTAQGAISVFGGNNALGAWVSPVPNNGGFNVFHTLVSAAGTNATLVKNSNANIGVMTLSNTSAAFKWVKVFNMTTAPTVGTSTPIMNTPIPPNSTIVVSDAAGLRLSSGLSYAITNGGALLDNTAVAAGDVYVQLSYV